ncbi:DddA-like double-stranded DNA deaminase toxin [Saccharopolyspora phatthalungensis]|uniref:Uncharacterized protein n=1 Tax=Saccharopolyspora phatthalungensis TaxID=664693 RepID=A0A840QAF8_9PSEU|nr:hypothetical protein [Saccharopolyspora phatthalungensis]
MVDSPGRHKGPIERVVDLRTHAKNGASVRPGQTYGVVVVNNAMCPGEQGCANAVRALLPLGYTLVVWEPGATKPTVIQAEARP